MHRLPLGKQAWVACWHQREGRRLVQRTLREPTSYPERRAVSRVSSKTAGVKRRYVLIVRGIPDGDTNATAVADAGSDDRSVVGGLGGEESVSSGEGHADV